MICHLVCFDVKVNIFFNHVGTKPSVPGYAGELKCLGEGQQRVSMDSVRVMKEKCLTVFIKSDKRQTVSKTLDLK